MRFSRHFDALLALTFALAIVPAFAPPPVQAAGYHDMLEPAPPGTLVQDQAFYPHGPGTMARWHAVLSKKLLGTQAGISFYQWYLSLYSMGDTHFKLAYRSPSNGGPFSVSAKAVPDDAHFWLPVQSGSIVGTPHLMNPEAQQLVVRVQNDQDTCRGNSAITVFAFDQTTSTMRPVVSIGGGCSVDASVVGSGAEQRESLRLTSHHPTRTATLAYRGGTWHLSSPYFKLHLLAK